MSKYLSVYCHYYMKYSKKIGNYFFQLPWLQILYFSFLIKNCASDPKQAEMFQM